MTDKLKRHIGIIMVAKAFFSMMVLTIFMWIFNLAFANIYQSVSPASSWFEYYSVQSIYSWYEKWQEIEVMTVAKRHKAIEMQRQDTLYCDRENLTIKYHTQYRPPEWTEYKIAWDIRGIWKYYPLVPEEENLCRICWVAIGTTQLGYKKTTSYCTDYFSVNQ